MKINEEYTLKIEKLTSEGKGIARLNNFVIFVENTCPQDIIRAKITHIKKNYAYAEITEIVSPSINRIQPICPMQKICGSCQIQYINYDEQLRIKKEIVEDCMKPILTDNLQIENVISSPETEHFRHKVQVPVRETKVSKKLLIGYFKPKSHEIINIKFCPIQTKTSDKIINFIREEAKNYKITGYDEKKHLGDLKHVVIRSSTLNEYLVTFVINNSHFGENYKKFAKALSQKFAEIKGICININTKKTNLILTDKTICIYGEEYITEKILDKTFKIGANTFFQVNPKSAENIFKYVKEEIEKNNKEPKVLDAYAGIASFGIVVCDVAKSVLSVEENPNSTALAQEVIKLNNIQNVEVKTADTGKFLETCKEKFDVIILDPPRKGCDKRALDESLRLCDGTIIYVSCNPATLARDLKYLKENGCVIKSVKPFDMFCHTLHVENVAIIKTNKNN